MTSIATVRKSLRDTRYMRTLSRVRDEFAIQCNLYVTDRCNLDCAYCTEYDNSKPHPPLDQVKAWLDHMVKLGTVRVALAGGEPLSHPDIVEIVRYARAIGLATSMTTNAFLLTEETLKELEEAGLEVMQISIDRMTPSKTTRKSLKSIAGKIDMVAASGIKLHLTGVICKDTLDECLEVLDYGLKRGIPSEVRLVHAGPDQLMRVDPGERAKVLNVIDTMIARKRRGEKVHTTDAILNYQRDLITGKDASSDWTCTGGYKIYFVSASGKFMECSMRPTPRDFLDIALDDLKSYNTRKACQKGCGVYCIVAMSKFVERPVAYLAPEIRARVKQAMAG